MTDREIMQQALKALETNQPVNYCMNNNGEKFPMMQEDPFRFDRNTKAIAALRERLAQPEQEHDDPIGDAQDKLIAEQAAKPCKVGGPCVPTQTGPCACKELPPPIGPVVEQPQMQPCAGRNCGSTNPNLHSAECFEDYEKSTGMRAWQGLTDEEINSVRHNRDWTAHWTDTTFARAIEAKLKEKNKW